jgi:outer membrane protein TolC
MKYFLKVILITIVILNLSDARANSLFDSLNSAYLKNPLLNAERASMRASKQEKNKSISEFLPSITISGYISDQNNRDGALKDFQPSEQVIEVEQKIFQGFSGVSNFRKKNMEKV